MSGDLLFYLFEGPFYSGHASPGPSQRSIARRDLWRFQANKATVMTEFHKQTLEALIMMGQRMLEEATA